MASDKPDIIEVDNRSLERDAADHEKATAIHTIDNIRVLGLSNGDADFYNSHTEKQRKSIIRKVSHSRA